MKNSILILCGLSASGKDTIANYLVKEYGYQFLVSLTTREMRPNEVNGRDYYFVDSSVIETIGIVERTEYAGNDYALSYDEVDNKLQKGNCITIMDHHGIEGMRCSKYGDRVYVILVMPESYKLMKNRFKNRGKYTEEDYENRCINFSEHLYGCFTLCDSIVVNRKNSTIDSLATKIHSMFKRRT